MLVLSDTKFDEKVDIATVLTKMTRVKQWVGQTVAIVGRRAIEDEVDKLMNRLQ